MNLIPKLVCQYDMTQISCPLITFAGHNIAQQGKNNLIPIYFYFHSFVFSSNTKLSYVLTPLRRLGEISIYVNRSKYNIVFVKTFIFRYNFSFTMVDIIFLHFKSICKFWINSRNKVPKYT